MQEQVFNKRPMVDVLSEQLGKRVVMSGDKYVYLDGSGVVDTNKVEIAVEELENDRVEWEATQYQRDRADEYNKQGITQEAITYAMAEKEAGDDTELKRLLDLKAQVKIDIPKT